MVGLRSRVTVHPAQTETLDLVWLCGIPLPIGPALRRAFRGQTARQNHRIDLGYRGEPRRGWAVLK